MNNDFMQMLENADRLIRPYALFINPSDLNENDFQELEKIVKVIKSNWVDKGKCYLIKKTDLNFCCKCGADMREADNE